MSADEGTMRQTRNVAHWQRVKRGGSVELLSWVSCRPHYDISCPDVQFCIKGRTAGKITSSPPVGLHAMNFTYF